MATTKKSTKAKTKTSKPAVARPLATKKTSPARSAKSAVTSKKLTVKPVKTTEVNRASRFSGGAVRSAGQLKVLSGLIFAALAVAAGVLMNATSYQVFTGHLAKDELASGAVTVFAPALHSLFDVEIRWAVVAIMALSAILPLIYLARRGRRDDEAALDRRFHVWRWLETGVVSGLMVAVVALLSGVQDFTVLLVLGGMIIISSLLRWCAEKQQVETTSTRKSISTLSIISCLLPGLVIGGYALATVLYGLIRTQWFVYALYAVLVVSFLAYVLNLRTSVKRAQADTITQRNYLVISAITRVAFAVILIYGLRK